MRQNPESTKVLTLPWILYHLFSQVKVQYCFYFQCGSETIGLFGQNFAAQNEDPYSGWGNCCCGSGDWRADPEHHPTTVRGLYDPHHCAQTEHNHGQWQVFRFLRQRAIRFANVTQLRLRLVCIQGPEQEGFSKCSAQRQKTSTLFRAWIRKA